MLFCHVVISVCAGTFVTCILKIDKSIDQYQYQIQERLAIAVLPVAKKEPVNNFIPTSTKSQTSASILRNSEQINE